jgi:hypothetical protein
LDLTGPEWNFTGGDPQIGGVDIATINDINPFVSWINPSLVMQHRGDRTIAEIDGGVWSTGDTVVAATAGTPAAPGSDLLAIGDIAEYDGTKWVKILDNVGGFVPVDTQVIAADDGVTLYSPLTTGADNGGILTANGAGGWTTTAPTEGDGTMVYGNGSTNENSIFGCQTTGLPSSWVQIAGGVSVTQVNGTFGILASPTTGVVTLSAVADSAPAGCPSGHHRSRRGIHAARGDRVGRPA